MEATSRGRIYTFLMILMLLVFGELLAFAFFTLNAARFHFPISGGKSAARYIATPEEVEHAQRSYSRELGWQINYPTPFGERPRGREYQRPFLSVYGDSFTHGDEVAHHQTWAAALSEILEADVYNFGNSAYGMDQTLLRFERDFLRRPTEIVLFGYISYDIERNVSVYWKFQQSESEFAYTKPRFQLDQGRLKLLPNPIPRREEMVKLLDPEFIQEMAKLDDWANRNRLPELGFPHLRFFFHPSIWDVALRQGRNPDLWSHEAPRRLAEEILLRFDRTARAQDAKPVIVLFPVLWELIAWSEHGEVPASHNVLETLCKQRELHCLSLLKEMGDRPSEEIAEFFTQGFDGGHYSPKGNQWVAAWLGRKLEKL